MVRVEAGLQIRRLHRGCPTLFTSRLGETTVPASTVKHVCSPKQKGQSRAGIARPGMIVTSEGLVREQLAANPNFSLFQDIAHEIGHFWWNFGAGQGDWIKEAFAEYYSAYAVQQIVSQQQFEAVPRKSTTFPPRLRRLPKSPFMAVTSSFAITKVPC